MDWQRVEGSFRDPSGFVYTRNGTLYRQVNPGFRDQFDAFLASGLYDELAGAGLLVPHRSAGLEQAASPEAYAVLEPERLPFISYPYEWSFGQLKDAALLTLDMQERALNRGQTLRDASAFNVQFRDGRPIFIDTLSFEPHEEGKPWVAYRQFCEHFYVPLALMSSRDVRAGQLLRTYLEGIPLDLGSKLLPHRSWLALSTLLHVHMHAWAQARYADAKVTTASKGKSMSRSAVLTLVRGLRSTIEKLDWSPAGTEWADYTTDNNYSDSASSSKRALVQDFLRRTGSPATVWDMGANTGEYTRAAREIAPQVVSFDVDPAAVERNYRRVRAKNETGILPLLMDVTNPSPDQGWGQNERLSLAERGPADAVLALALVHHLAIGRNVPLVRVAEYFARLGRTLIIEFVPKSDSQVKRLLLNRPDIFPEYTKDGFERAFGQVFDLRATEPVAESERWLYLMAPRAGVRA